MMTKDEAIRITTQYAIDNNFWIGNVEVATFLLASPPVREKDEWSVVFENRMVVGSGLVITVDPQMRQAEVYVP